MKRPFTGSRRDYQWLGWLAVSCLLVGGVTESQVRRTQPLGPMKITEEAAPLNGSAETPPAPAAGPTVTEPVRTPTAPTQLPAQSPEANPPPPSSEQSPVQQAGPPAEQSSTSPRKRSGKRLPELESISINSADAATLATLPGVGTGLAARVIDYRTQNGPFSRIEDIQNVPGFGERRYAKIAPYIRL